MYNAIPGRYVNRIGNGTYSIGDEEFATEKNDGDNTLHSGSNNWSYRFWEVRRRWAVGGGWTGKKKGTGGFCWGG